MTSAEESRIEDRGMGRAAEVKEVGRDEATELAKE